MDSDEDTFDNVDSGNVSSGDDDFPMEVDMVCSKERQSEPEDYPFEVLTTEEIVQHMVDCIKEVNTVVEVSSNRNKQIAFCPFSLFAGGQNSASLNGCDSFHAMVHLNDDRLFEYAKFEDFSKQKF